MTEPGLFAVVTTQRSGSSWLVDLLDSHLEIAAYAELFLVGDRNVRSTEAEPCREFEARRAGGRTPPRSLVAGSRTSVGSPASMATEPEPRLGSS